MAAYRVSPGRTVICDLCCGPEQCSASSMSPSSMQLLPVDRYVCMQCGAHGQSALRCRLAGKRSAVYCAGSQSGGRGYG